ncbi:MAG: hypothetical protein H0V49_01300 [Nocardioidaceae bacterium]|nr:hypothetical protein [Nocardioidaceae bacterium]
MRLRQPIIAVSTVTLLSLAACGGSGADPDPNAGDDTGAGGTTETTAGGGDTGEEKEERSGAAPDIEGAEPGGTMKVISINGLNSMDPSESYYVNTASILSGLVTRSLTQYVYNPDTKQMTLIPDLATKIPVGNEDLTEWTMELREGVKWENGDPVTPEELAYGIKRSFDRESFPEGAAYSNDYFLDGDKYKGPYKSGTKYKGIEIDGNKLTFKMSKPFPDFPYWGAFPAMGPIPLDEKINEPSKYALHPWSTGPYMFGKYTPEKALELVKNPEWDPETDPGRRQLVDSYQMEFDVPTAKIDQILLEDDPNTITYDNISATVFPKFQQEAQDRLVVGSDPCTFMWFPDYREITDINVRKALAYAYPYGDAYAAGGYIEGVTRTFGTNIMPPGIPGREEYNPLPDHDLGETDAATAKKLLEEADAVGYEIKFAFATDDPVSVDVKNAVVRGLTNAGFKASPVASTLAEISTLRADPDAPLNVRSGGWCSDWPSGGSWFPPVFETTNLDEEGLGSNYAVFSEPEVDKEIERIQTIPVEEQPAAWNALDQTIMEKYLPVFVTGYGGVAMAHGSGVQGMEDDNVFGMPTWKDMWLKP